MQTLCLTFNTNRTIEEYTEKFYLSVAIEHNNLKKIILNLQKIKQNGEKLFIIIGIL
jgi:hypothetical protein